MPQRSITNETARCPICRYGVCPRSHSASIIEFSKCVRRHQVTKLFGLPSQPLRLRNGVTASVSPFCISTMVPYWSNASALISRLSTSGVAMAFKARSFVLWALQRRGLGALPSPLWGGVGVGVVRFFCRWRHHYLAASPPPQPSPTRGEGADRVRRLHRFHFTQTCSSLRLVRLSVSCPASAGKADAASSIATARLHSASRRRRGRAPPRRACAGLAQPGGAHHLPARG